VKLRIKIVLHIFLYLGYKKNDRVTRDMEREVKIDFDKLSLILFNTSKTSDD